MVISESRPAMVAHHYANPIISYSMLEDNLMLRRLLSKSSIGQIRYQTVIFVPFTHQADQLIHVVKQTVASFLSDTRQ